MRGRFFMRVSRAAIIATGLGNLPIRFRVASPSPELLSRDSAGARGRIVGCRA
jgi:hypothetical protein